MVVTMTGSGGDIWGQRAGVFQSMLRSIPGKQLPPTLLLWKGISKYWDDDRTLERVCGLEGVEKSKRINYALCHLKNQEAQFHTFGNFRKYISKSSTHPHSTFIITLLKNLKDTLKFNSIGIKTFCVISPLLNVLRPRIWFILMNVWYALNVYSVVVGQNVL